MNNRPPELLGYRGYDLDRSNAIARGDRCSLPDARGTRKAYEAFMTVVAPVVRPTTSRLSSDVSGDSWRRTYLPSFGK
jgi:hypothetical protein